MITKITDEVINRLINGDTLNFHSNLSKDYTMPNEKIYYNNFYEEFIIYDMGEKEEFAISRKDVGAFKEEISKLLEYGTLEWEN